VTDATARARRLGPLVFGSLRALDALVFHSAGPLPDPLSTGSLRSQRAAPCAFPFVSTPGSPAQAIGRRRRSHSGLPSNGWHSQVEPRDLPSRRRRCVGGRRTCCASRECERARVRLLAARVAMPCCSWWQCTYRGTEIPRLGAVRAALG